MTAPITVPVNVSPEAAARLAELGYQAECERMLEKIREIVPGLRRIAVWLSPAYHPCEEDKIDLVAFTMPQDASTDAAISDRFRDWKIATFSDDVRSYFLFSLLNEEPHAG
jgi:hypothetical protein